MSQIIAEIRPSANAQNFVRVNDRQDSSTATGVFVIQGPLTAAQLLAVQTYLYAATTGVSTSSVDSTMTGLATLPGTYSNTL